MDVKEICKKLLEKEDELTDVLYSFYKRSNKIHDEIYAISLLLKQKKDSDLVRKREGLYKQLEAMEKEKSAAVEGLRKVREKLAKFSNVLDDESVLIGEKVDLYKPVLFRMDDYEYKICLHGTKKVIGAISFRGEPERLYPEYDGNIGYAIDEQYRGNGYAVEALKGLANKLYADGIKEVYIAMVRRNYASQRVAEKCGGKLVNECCDDFKLLYKCDLKRIKEIKKR